MVRPCPTFSSGATLSVRSHAFRRISLGNTMVSLFRDCIWFNQETAGMLRKGASAQLQVRRPPSAGLFARIAGDLFLAISFDASHQVFAQNTFLSFLPVHGALYLFAAPRSGGSKKSAKPTSSRARARFPRSSTCRGTNATHLLSVTTPTSRFQCNLRQYLVSALFPGRRPGA